MGAKRDSRLAALGVIASRRGPGIGVSKRNAICVPLLPPEPQAARCALRPFRRRLRILQKGKGAEQAGGVLPAQVVVSQYDLELVVKHEEGKDQVLLVPEDVLLEYPRAWIVPGKKNVVKVNRTPLFSLGSKHQVVDVRC